MRAWILSIAAICSVGCGSSERSTTSENAAPAPSAEVAKTAEAPATDASTMKTEPTAAPAAPAAEADAGAPSEPSIADPRPEWPTVTKEDEVPVCVFASYEERGKAPFVEQVRKQKLPAGAPLILGAFPPWCMNEKCDARPTLQCWIDQEGDGTLVVHSKFSVEHKPDSSCKGDCEIVAASCETPELPKGKYTLRHGTQTMEISVPGVLRDPCFKKAK